MYFIRSGKVDFKIVGKLIPLTIVGAVAIAEAGDKPTNISAGSEINPPPPTTESIKAAKKQISGNNGDVYECDVFYSIRKS
jgi:hypothetical protein